jgi:hypothetical protein
VTFAVVPQCRQSSMGGAAMPVTKEAVSAFRDGMIQSFDKISETIKALSDRANLGDEIAPSIRDLAGFIREKVDALAVIELDAETQGGQIKAIQDGVSEIRGSLDRLEELTSKCDAGTEILDGHSGNLIETKQAMSNVCGAFEEAAQKEPERIVTRQATPPIRPPLPSQERHNVV